MATFEDIPEDRAESHPCPVCRTGNITELEDKDQTWACDKCDFIHDARFNK